MFNARPGTVIVVARTSQPQPAGFLLTLELTHAKLLNRSRGQDQPDSPVHFHAERLPVTDRSPQERIARKSRRGFRGYPIATIAWYGPDISRASKVVVGIVREDRGDVVALRKWFASMLDARQDEVIGAAILHFLQEQGVQSVVMSADLLGCPHEEGIDYPEGHECPACPYWAGRGRPI